MKSQIHKPKSVIKHVFCKNTQPQTTQPIPNVALPAAYCLLAVFCLLLTGCFNLKPKINPINPEFGKYISGYTSGMVSRKSTIRIELSASVNGKDALTAQAAMDSLAVLVNTTADASVQQRLRRVMSQLPDSSLLKNIFTFEPAKGSIGSKGEKAPAPTRLIKCFKYKFEEGQ